MKLTLPLITLFAGVVLTLDVPPNVREFYQRIQRKVKCSHELASDFFNSQFENGVNMSYCGDHLGDYGIVYLQGPGKLSNMDVDCDGAQSRWGDNHRYHRCEASSSTLPRTSIREIIQQYDVGVHDLSTHVHSFVVFGNPGQKEGWETFDPRKFGIEKASIMAIVCSDKMFCGIWGDSNSDDGERPSVGEVSLSLATACYGPRMNGGSGDGSSHDEADVLYFAFAGHGAVPGPNGADWSARSFDDFHASLVDLGNRLTARIGHGYGSPAPALFQHDCSWLGHCKGASCRVAQDCADDMTCVKGWCL